MVHAVSIWVVNAQPSVSSGSHLSVGVNKEPMITMRGTARQCVSDSLVDAVLEHSFRMRETLAKVIIRNAKMSPFKINLRLILKLLLVANASSSIIDN